MLLPGASVSSTTSVPSAKPSLTMETMKQFCVADPTTDSMLLLGRLIRKSLAEDGEGGGRGEVGGRQGGGGWEVGGGRGEVGGRQGGGGGEVGGR